VDLVVVVAFVCVLLFLLFLLLLLLLLLEETIEPCGFTLGQSKCENIKMYKKHHPQRLVL